MQVFENIKTKIADAHQGAVIVIGNFDGVHKGHQSLLKRAKIRAAAQNVPLGVLTFDPHPRLFFAPDSKPFLLTNKDQKTELLAQFGADFAIFERFDATLSQKSPQDFVDMLAEKYNPSLCIVGKNFHFGHKKQGTGADLIKLGHAAGFDVQVLDLEEDPSAKRYSSTEAREAIRRGDVDGARNILGHPWAIESPVIKGEQRGREIGYPTANQEIAFYIQPKYGVYAVRVRLKGADNWLDGVANFGIRPMFEVETPLLETYIFDFDKDIYGETLCVAPVQYLRGEMNFDSLDDLIIQIDQDAMKARRILGTEIKKVKTHV